MDYSINVNAINLPEHTLLLDKLNSNRCKGVQAGIICDSSPLLCIKLSNCSKSNLKKACHYISTFALTVLAPAVTESDLKLASNIKQLSNIKPSTVNTLARSAANKAYSSWQEEASTRMLLALSENPTLSLEGFLRFRMRDYIDCLNVQTLKLIGSLNVEQEYQNFIQVLKQYAAANRTETTNVTIVFDGYGGYTLHTTSGRKLLSVPFQYSESSSSRMLITLLDSISPRALSVLGSKFMNNSLKASIIDLFQDSVRFDS